MMKKVWKVIIAWVQNVVLDAVGSKKTLVTGSAAAFFFPFSPAWSIK